MSKKGFILWRWKQKLNPDRLKDQRPITKVKGLTPEEWNDRVRQAHINEGFIIEINKETEEDNP